MDRTALPCPSTKLHIANHYIRASIGGALRQGADAQVLLAAADIPADWLDQPRCPISERQLSELIKAVWRYSGDEFMGLAPGVCKRGVFSLMAELACAARTLGGMLEQSARFYRAVSNDIDVGLADDPDALLFYRLHLHHQGQDPDHLLQEFLLLMWQRFASWLVGQQVPFASTCFNYHVPAHGAEYRAMFLGELLYDRPYCGFSLHRRFLQLPIVRNAAQLQGFLGDCPRVILHRPVRDASLQARVRLLLQRHDFEQMPDIEQLSEHLRMSPRTLRRRLTDEGASVRQIKDTLRRDFAQTLLTREHLNVQEVAEQSGFAEAAAFCHAFKRWTGLSPAAWRKHRR
ncbi:AraC family transcriptional regulator [Halomonas sp. V046]|uniref:AraC family transcriptional regulator n=1 Tax=Halomonas sp. V046 TaxID=3459611 RepID=UPI0040448EC1